MTKIIILDDEEHCTDILQSLITKTQQDYQIAGVFNDPVAALAFIREHEFDLLFLDIQMPGMNGFKLLDKLLPVSFDIIFTTAYDQYAIRAFKYSAINYLLKPITEKALVKALLSWEQRKQQVKTEQWQLLQSALSDSESEPHKIALPTGTGFEVMKLSEIVRCQSDDNYTAFYFADGNKTLVCRTLKDVEAMLSEHSFFRVHQSHLINGRFVETISRQDGGLITMSDGAAVPVSQQRKDYINELLGSMLRFE
jgi:two-component system LytT family response regulator